MTLDAAFLPTAEGSPRKLGQLRALITLLHESGAMVALEGLAQPEALGLAPDTPVDLVSGPAVWPWAPPAPTAMGSPLAGPAALPALNRPWQPCAPASRWKRPAPPCFTKPGYCGATCRMTRASSLRKTSPRRHAQRSTPLAPWPRPRAQAWPTALTSVGPAHPGALLVSDPYFSLPDGGPCQTLSASFLCDGQRQVLCCDLELPRPPSGLRPRGEARLSSRARRP